MRKVLSFVLVLSLVLGSFGMAFAAPLSDIAGKDCEEAVSVLTQLGVVSGYPDGSFKPENIVTRAEMAVIVVSALGLADYAKGGTAKFSDMAGHWSNPFVAYAASLGIIAGYPDGTFKPDKTVSYDEAATMLVAALGYTPDSLVGTWPANYVVKAKALGILDGITGGAAGANRGDIAIMAYQTLDQAIGNTNKDGDWNANGTEAKPDTMLARLGAKFVEADVILGTEDTLINLKPYIGAYAETYTKDGDILAVNPLSVFLTGSFDETVAVNKSFETVVFDADKDYTITDKATGAAFYFENGVEDADGFEAAADKTFTIAAKVSGLKITKVYSVAKWVVDADDIVGTADIDGIFDDLELLSAAFAENDDEEIDLDSFQLVGVGSLKDIKKGNVVYVYTDDSADEIITKIEVGTEVVTGEVTKISSSSKQITVNGKVYKYAKDELDQGTLNKAVANNNGVKLGDEVELSLDVNGYIYDLETVEATPDNFAVYLSGEDSVSIRYADAVELFLADGTSKVFDVDSDLTAGGIVGADVEGFENVTAGALVLYSVNKDGEIDALEVVTVDNTAAEQEVTNYYDSRAIASDVVVFTFETDGVASDADDYGVTTLAKIKGNEYAANSVRYYYDNDTKKITAMVLTAAGAGDDDVYGLFTGASNTSASSTDYLASFLVDGAAKDYEVANKTAYDAIKGKDKDVLYTLGLNGKGEVTGLAETDHVTTAAITAQYANGVVKVGETEYTVDADALAYKWSEKDTKFNAIKINGSTLNKDVYVIFYDLDETPDGVIDFILVVPTPEV